MLYCRKQHSKDEKKGNRKRKKKEKTFRVGDNSHRGRAMPGTPLGNSRLTIPPQFSLQLVKTRAVPEGTRKLEMPQELVRFAIGLRNGNRDAKHNWLNREKVKQNYEHKHCSRIT